MREILFRAKEINRWVYGDLLTHESFQQNEVCIRDYVNHMQFIVNPSTVGQYTGLKDKNGTKIFEGDIVRGKDYSGLRREGSVEFDEIMAKYIIVPNTKSQYREHNTIENLCPAEGYLEIIGDIYDNPELLGGSNESKSN